MYRTFLLTVILLLSGGYAQAGLMFGSTELSVSPDAMVTTTLELLSENDDSDPVFVRNHESQSDLAGSPPNGGPGSTVSQIALHIVSWVSTPQLVGQLHLDDFLIPPSPELDGLIKPPQSQAFTTDV